VEVSLFPRRKAGKAAERMAKKGEARPVHIHRKSIEALESVSTGGYTPYMSFLELLKLNGYTPLVSRHVIS
jgi:ATP sulfurylase